ncbi:MAG: DUF4437 domain-containing protein [Leptolyngbya sp. SIO3F4]|nr:DUF4437 domain-containing protein [Leptolyngbya sp. SIO3F4]
MSDQPLTSNQKTTHFLQVAPIPEDWGGDGSSRMTLSGRCTAISNEYRPHEYEFFDSNAAPEEIGWKVPGMPEHVVPVKRRLLNWHDCGASTSRVTLLPDFEVPSGIFTADLEIFVLSGRIQLGEWQLRKHGYSFIPAGVRVGPLRVLDGKTAEVLWMENGPVPLKYKKAQKHHPDARINDFIPALDSQSLPWGRTETFQFEQAKKKYLRKANNGGGVWLITIFPHYDGLHPEIQCYNEEAYCLSGCIDIGNYRFFKDHAAYCASFCTSPRHQTDEGTLFFIRVDRDLSQLSRVLSYPF